MRSVLVLCLLALVGHALAKKIYVDSGIGVDLDTIAESLLQKLDYPSVPYVSTVVANTSSALHMVMAFNTTKSCHYHDSDAFMTLVSGQWQFVVPTAAAPVVLGAGDEFLTPKDAPHSEGVVEGTGPAVFYVTWSPPPSSDNTHMIPDSRCEQGP